VADGMGGHRAGEQASALALVSVEQFMLNTLRWFLQLKGEGSLVEFQEVLRSADARIFEAARNAPELKGMGTTLTMAYVIDGTLYLVHAGDSRCYLLRDGELHQLTRDHTLVAQMVQDGAMSQSDVKTSPFRNVITNAVGGNDPGVKAEVNKLQLQADDVIMLCSDGLYGMVADDELARRLAEVRDPATACAQLVARANEAGGSDNITVIVGRVEASREPEVAAQNSAV
jgi:PPM family protein phosphatase